MTENNELMCVRFSILDIRKDEGVFDNFFVPEILPYRATLKFEKGEIELVNCFQNSLRILNL